MAFEKDWIPRWIQSFYCFEQSLNNRRKIGSAFTTFSTASIIFNFNKKVKKGLTF